MSQLPFILIRPTIFYTTQRYFVVYYIGQTDDDFGGICSTHRRAET